MSSAEGRVLMLQARYRQMRQWPVLYAVQALGDRWRALERRKDRQRQAFDAAMGLATDLDFQQALGDAKEQLDQATSHEVPAGCIQGKREKLCLAAVPREPLYSNQVQTVCNQGIALHAWPVSAH